MKSNKQLRVRTSSATKQSDIIKEMYNLVESRSGNIPNDVRLTPKEFGRQLASDLIKKIEDEVKINK
jgi:hypothetical protein